MPSEFIFFIFILLGLTSGLLGGLLGIGGGVITVPILYFIFEYTGMFEDKTMQIAVSTSLAASIITSAVSTLAQLRKKAVHFTAIQFLAPGLILGCLFGSLTAHLMPSALLRLIFSIMAMLLGLYFFFPRLPPLHISSAPNKTLSLFGLLIGSLSSMLGIGGGALTFPVLLGYQIPIKNCSASSALSTLISTMAATLTYLTIAWNKPELPETFGYIELPAFIAISIGSLITSPIGVKLSHTLDVLLIKRIFGGSLILIGLSMLIL